MRFAVDTGGTFTDLVIEEADGSLWMYKAPTTPDDPVQGVLNVLETAAGARGTTCEALLSNGELFIHGTTRAINAIVTGVTARTALLVTEGHPDILLFREGGRIEPFNFTVPYPAPYVPRAMTFEIRERVGPEGEVIRTLNEEAVIDLLERLDAQGVEAIAVSLLWSIVNPDHERRIGELIEKHAPSIAYTLSHQVNPTLREYRRTISTAIDASLKPLMHGYMSSLEERLVTSGFTGRVLIVTSQGGVMDAKDIAAQPIHSINSGPAMAPVAGQYYGRIDGESHTAIVADTGGTTYDISVIRDGRIPWTRETWLGQPFRSHMTGFPSVDVKSIGAGGGSIAWVDRGGLLHVGPMSAGAEPGPVCYGRGGEVPTLTDAALVLGYIDAENFLGGRMQLDTTAAHEALERDVAKPLGLGTEEAASAVVRVASENMVRAIEDITINQGIDPSEAVLIGGGGAAGLNTVAIGQHLRCRRVIIPEAGPVLSAAGALMSDLSAQFRRVFKTNTADFDHEGAQRVIAELKAACRKFMDGPGQGSLAQTINFSIEGHYPSQVWDIEVACDAETLDSPDITERLTEAFHRAHKELFAFADTDSPVDIVSWQAQARCQLREGAIGGINMAETAVKAGAARNCYFPDTGRVSAPIHAFERLSPEMKVEGPAIVESPLTTVVINPGTTAQRTESGSLVVNLAAR
ncbi:MAG: hydantoinase/oxoprolinase family protein [Pseudomonadota bacterium]